MDSTNTTTTIETPAAPTTATAPAAPEKVARRRTRNGPVALRTRVAPRHTADRNAVVRRVMTELKLSMIEASKHVKNNGLWKNDVKKSE